MKGGPGILDTGIPGQDFRRFLYAYQIRCAAFVPRQKKKVITDNDKLITHIMGEFDSFKVHTTN